MMLDCTVRLAIAAYIYNNSFCEVGRKSYENTAFKDKNRLYDDMKQSEIAHL